MSTNKKQSKFSFKKGSYAKNAKEEDISQEELDSLKKKAIEKEKSPKN